MKRDYDLIKGTVRIHRLNKILSELTIPELEYLYIALPAIIEYTKKNET